MNGVSDAQVEMEMIETTGAVAISFKLSEPGSQRMDSTC